MTEPSRRASVGREIALDAVTFVLFAGFVVLLFVGYLGVYASVPSTGLAALFLFGSLGVLAFANLSADRRLQELTPSAPA